MATGVLTRHRAGNARFGAPFMGRTTHVLAADQHFQRPRTGCPGCLTRHSNQVLRSNFGLLDVLRGVNTMQVLTRAEFRFLGGFTSFTTLIAIKHYVFSTFKIDRVTGRGSVSL